MDQEVTATKKKVEDYKERKDTAYSDLLEVRRDLALYENNFSESCGLVDRLRNCRQMLMATQ